MTEKEQLETMLQALAADVIGVNDNDQKVSSITLTRTLYDGARLKSVKFYDTGKILIVNSEK